MANRRRQMDEALAKVYAAIPEIPDCDGRCWTSCGPIDMSPRERQRIRQAGVRITDYADSRAKIGAHFCEALTQDKRCSVYELRPVICRLWGVTRQMRCPYGCIPVGGLLDDEEGFRLLSAAMRAGGGGPEWRVLADRIASYLSDPRLGPAIRERLEQGHDGDMRRAWKYGDLDR